MEKKHYKVHSLERGLDLIEILSSLDKEISLTELSDKSGFTPSTTHRILDALKSRGYIKQNPENSKYNLSFKLFEIGTKIIRRVSLREEAVPVLRSLANETGESAYLLIRDNYEALCLERIDGFHFMKLLYLQVGGRMPLHIGAGPKILLASLPDEEIDHFIRTTGLPALTRETITNPLMLKEELEKIRRQGYALSIGDNTDGGAALSCPVRNWQCEVVATVSIAGFANHFSPDRIDSLIKIVSDGARELSTRLNAPG